LIDRLSQHVGGQAFQEAVGICVVEEKA